MSDHTESAVEPARGLAAEPLDPLEQLELAMGAIDSTEQQTESKEEEKRPTETLEPSREQNALGTTETLEPSGEQNELGTKGGLQFFFKVSACK